MPWEPCRVPSSGARGGRGCPQRWCWGHVLKDRRVFAGRREAGRPPRQREQWRRAAAKLYPKLVSTPRTRAEFAPAKALHSTFWDKIILGLAASLASIHQMPAEVCDDQKYCGPCKCALEGKITPVRSPCVRV